MQENPYLLQNNSLVKDKKKAHSMIWVIQPQATNNFNFLIRQRAQKGFNSQYGFG